MSITVHYLSVFAEVLILHLFSGNLLPLMVIKQLKECSIQLPKLCFMKLLFLLLALSIYLSGCLKNDAVKRNLVDAKVIKFRNTGGCSGGWIMEAESFTFRASSITNENELTILANRKGFPFFIRIEYGSSRELSPCSDIYRPVAYWEPRD
jgi:hypothetical protein